MVLIGATRSDIGRILVVVGVMVEHFKQGHVVVAAQRGVTSLPTTALRKHLIDEIVSVVCRGATAATVRFGHGPVEDIVRRLVL